jgi:hypothetical protein
MYFTDTSGRECKVASPMDDHSKVARRTFPPDQLAASGQGIAQVARSVGGRHPHFPIPVHHDDCAGDHAARTGKGGCR